MADTTREDTVTGKKGYIITFDSRKALEKYVNEEVTKAVNEYHNEITDNETKVWLTKEDLDKRIAQAVREAQIHEIDMALGIEELWVSPNSKTNYLVKRKSELTQERSE